MSEAGQQDKREAARALAITTRARIVPEATLRWIRNGWKRGHPRVLIATVRVLWLSRSAITARVRVLLPNGSWGSVRRAYASDLHRVRH